MSRVAYFAIRSKNTNSCSKLAIFLLQKHAWLLQSGIFPAPKKSKMSLPSLTILTGKTAKVYSEMLTLEE